MTLRSTALAGVLALACASSAAMAEEPSSPRIVVDAGHGGNVDGAHGPTGLLEKNVCLQIARRVRDKLQKELGAQVWLTRDGDTSLPLPARVDFANHQQPDLFLSIHANSMPTRRMRARIEGIETYFLSASASNAAARAAADRENADAPTPKARGDSTLDFILQDLQRTEAHADSSRLAYSIHPRLVAGTGGVDRGVQQAPFYVLAGVESPAVLIEVGYISHPEEGLRLGRPEYQERIATAVTEGVKAFLEEMGRREAPRGAAPQAQPTPP